MYRSDLKTRDKGGAIAAVIAIHAALLFVFMHLAGKVDLTDPQRVLQVFDIIEVPPPPPPTPEVPRPAEKTQKPEDPEGAASRENIRSRATPVVAPKPPIALPIPLPVNVTQTPNEGAVRTQGASDVPGQGTGAGGTGTGTGSGGSGSGTGGGGEGIATRAQPITRGPRGRDFPSHLRRLLSGGYSPWVKFTIEPSGRLSNCRVYQTSGNAELDSATCALVTRHLVYRPAINRRGEPVASEGIYRQAF
jgi:periplasmic protein TonB